MLGFIGSNFSETYLKGANFSGANLEMTNIEYALSLKDTNLHRTTELTKEQLEACKAKEAIIDEDVTISPSQPTPSSSPTSQNNEVQVQSSPLASLNAPIFNTSESITPSS